MNEMNQELCYIFKILTNLKKITLITNFTCDITS